MLWLKKILGHRADRDPVNVYKFEEIIRITAISALRDLYLNTSCYCYTTGNCDLRYIKLLVLTQPSSLPTNLLQLIPHLLLKTVNSKEFIVRFQLGEYLGNFFYAFPEVCCQTNFGRHFIWSLFCHHYILNQEIETLGLCFFSWRIVRTDQLQCFCLFI